MLPVSWRLASPNSISTYASSLYQKKGTALLAHFSPAIPRAGVDQIHIIYTVVAMPSNPSVLGRHRTINFE